MGAGHPDLVSLVASSLILGVTTIASLRKTRKRRERGLSPPDGVLGCLARPAPITRALGSTTRAMPTSCTRPSRWPQPSMPATRQRPARG